MAMSMDVTCGSLIIIIIIIIIIIRLDRSTTYVDAAYCYRRSSVVFRSVCRCVTLVSLAKTAAPIEIPFGLWAWLGWAAEIMC